MVVSFLRGRYYNANFPRLQQGKRKYFRRADGLGGIAALFGAGFPARPPKIPGRRAANISHKTIDFLRAMAYNQENRRPALRGGST